MYLSDYKPSSPRGRHIIGYVLGENGIQGFGRLLVICFCVAAPEQAAMLQCCISVQYRCVAAKYVFG